MPGQVVEVDDELGEQLIKKKWFKKAPVATTSPAKPKGVAKGGKGSVKHG
jgi:hypothetical protein